MTILVLVLGLVALVGGADLLVRGAARLAISAGISSLAVGLTIVAFGTSAPELVVSVQSAWQDQAALSIGNVVGSNIFNVLFILGVSAIITPLVVAHQLVRLDVPLMIGASILLLLLGLDGSLGRVDGAILFALIVAYTVWMLRLSRVERGRDEKPGHEVEGESGALASHWMGQFLMIVAGLILLVLGSNWLVDAATSIARTLGVSELVIGLTIVAVGTSLPEAATSIVAAMRGERDIAVGNVVGSNIFNILSVLGISSFVAPGGLEIPRAALAFDIPFMIAVAIACLPIFFTGYKIERWEGGLFLGYYVAYTVCLVLAATDHPLFTSFVTMLVVFVLPISAIPIAVQLIQSLRHRRTARGG